MRQKTPNISSAVIELVGVRKHSSDSITDSSRGSNNHEKDRTERPRLFSRSSKEKELEPVPETTLALVDESRAQRDSSSSPKNPSFLQRVSSTLTRRKDTSSTTLTPPQPPPPAPVEAVKKTYLHVGSINVQLPDTMLWKRRFMKIDTEGWLFLSLTDDENAPQTRRYFISTEVKSVDLPDVDEQELPHSVRLMLREGGMLQCACQNNSEQKQVLKAVRDCLA